MVMSRQGDNMDDSTAWTLLRSAGQLTEIAGEIAGLQGIDLPAMRRALEVLAAWQLETRPPRLRVVR